MTEGNTNTNYSLIQSLSHELRSVRKENDLLWKFLHEHQLSEGVQSQLSQFLGPDSSSCNLPLPPANPANSQTEARHERSNSTILQRNHAIETVSNSQCRAKEDSKSVNPAKTEALAGKVLKSGFLLKKGRTFGSWKSRYFELLPDRLEYYKSKKKDSPLGYIPLSTSISVLKPKADANEGSYSCAFAVRNELVSLSKMFIAPTEAGKKIKFHFSLTFLFLITNRHIIDRDEWVELLVKCIESFL